MYYIITNNKEIYDFAKEKGAQILNISQSVVIEAEEKNEALDANSNTVAEFLSNFPNMDVKSLGARCLEYILSSNMKLKGDLRKTVYPNVAEHFGTSVNVVTRALCCTHKRCLSKFSNKEVSKFFSGKECCFGFSPLLSFEFIRLCRKYIDKKNVKKEKGIEPKKIGTFFSGFAYINKNTLGYKCVKYILENDIDCTGEYEKTVYPILTKKFKTKVGIIKQSLTYFFNNCRFNPRFGMPEEFKKIYEQYSDASIKRTVEESNFAFISLCKRYLKEN